MLVISTLLLSAARPGVAAPQPSITRPQLNCEELARQYQGAWSAPPLQVPTQKLVDGPILGNGDLGVVLGGSADRLTLYIGSVDSAATGPELCLSHDLSVAPLRLHPMTPSQPRVAGQLTTCGVEPPLPG